MTKQCIVLNFGWEGAVNILEQCLVLLEVLLGPQDLHPTIYEIYVINDAVNVASTRLQ